MIIGAVICLVLAFISGLACVRLAFDDEEGGSGLLAAIHVCLVIASTVLLCLHSAKASFICGAVCTAFTGALFLATFGCDDIDGILVRLLTAIMIVVDLACASAGYLNTYAFFEWAISCSVLCVLAFINFLLTMVEYHYDWYDGSELAFNVVNIVFVALTAIGLIVGYSVNATRAKDFSVSVDTAIYRYDDFNAELGEQIPDDGLLYFNERYAVRLDINFSDLYALTTESRSVVITVTFPAEGVLYVADGVGFEQNGSTANWKYNLTVNARSSKQIESGYFIFNYSSETLTPPVSPIKISVVKIEEDTSGRTSIWESTCKLHYGKHEYDFNTQTNVKKDLSASNEGRYRIYYPVGCEAFKIMIYDKDKVGVYYEATVARPNGGEHYFLDIPAVIKANVSGSVYAQLVNEHERVSVEITALESSDYFGKSIEFEFDF